MGVTLAHAHSSPTQIDIMGSLLGKEDGRSAGSEEKEEEEQTRIENIERDGQRKRKV